MISAVDPVQLRSDPATDSADGVSNARLTCSACSKRVNASPTWPPIGHHHQRRPPCRTATTRSPTPSSRRPKNGTASSTCIRPNSDTGVQRVEQPGHVAWVTATPLGTPVVPRGVNEVGGVVGRRRRHPVWVGCRCAGPRTSIRPSGRTTSNRRPATRVGTAGQRSRGIGVHEPSIRAVRIAPDRSANTPPPALSTANTPPPTPAHRSNSHRDTRPRARPMPDQQPRQPVRRLIELAIRHRRARRSSPPPPPGRGHRAANNTGTDTPHRLRSTARLPTTPTAPARAHRDPARSIADNDRAGPRSSPNTRPNQLTSRSMVARSNRSVA